MNGTDTRDLSLKVPSERLGQPDVMKYGNQTWYLWITNITNCTTRMTGTTLPVNFLFPMLILF